MHASTLLTLLAATLASAGTTYVNNACPYDIYITHSDQSGNPDTTTLIAGNGGAYSEPLTGSGVAVKFTTDGNVYSGNDSELDYSLATGDYAGLYYSLGENGAGFSQDGLQIVPSVASCPTISCPAGDDSACGNQGTQYCDPSADLTVTLCYGQ